MKIRHTPGPWWNPSFSNEVMTTPDGQIKICRVFAVSEENSGEANAKLIAAAPELLEVLEDVAASRHIMMVQSPSKIELAEILATFERVKTVINKAKGQ